MPNQTLITGANGFVGRHLLRELCIRPEAGKIAAAALPVEIEAAQAWSASDEACRAARNLSWHGVELTAPGAVERAIDELRPDFVYHLAARSSGADTERDAVFEMNVEVTRRLLKSISQFSPGAKALLISTGYAYGNVDPDRPAVETDQLAEPGQFGAYTDSKIAMEGVSLEFPETAIVARAFSHTGPGQAPAFAVPAFALQLARIERGLDDPVLRVGNLTAQRDMLDVRDVVQAYRLLAKLGEPGSVYNLATGRPHRMSDILDALRSMSTVNTSVELDPARLRPADIACSTGDSTRLQSLTGWAPHIPFGVTLQDTLAWWRRQP